jgi:hypothetical protein
VVLAVERPVAVDINTYLDEQRALKLITKKEYDRLREPTRGQYFKKFGKEKGKPSKVEKSPKKWMWDPREEKK